MTFKVNYGLQGTSDIHGNSKTRLGIHFMVELLFNKNASTRSWSNAEFWSFHVGISEVPSNP